MGRVERIWLKKQRRGPMEEVGDARLIASRGIEGNLEQGGNRQVTLVDQAAWERATARLDGVDPVARRANVLLSGIDLEESAERVLELGDCLIRIGGETLPCDAMDRACDGLRAALGPNWGGGAYGMVLRGGSLRAGAAADWAEDSAADAGE